MLHCRPIMLLLFVAIPAAMLAAAPEDPSPAGGHTPAAGHDRPAADMPGSVPGAGSRPGEQPSGTAWELTCERDLLYAASCVGDSIPVRVFLESGVYFPLIDSALVWSHPGLFEPVELERPVRFRMAGGTDYSARYKLAPGVRVGDTRSLCESYVVDLRRRKPCDLLYPLHTFTTDSVAAPGIFELDVRRGIFRPLSSGSLPQPGDGWEAYELVPDGIRGCSGSWIRCACPTTGDAAVRCRCGWSSIWATPTCWHSLRSNLRSENSCHAPLSIWWKAIRRAG